MAKLFLDKKEIDNLLTLLHTAYDEDFIPREEFLDALGKLEKKCKRAQKPIKISSAKGKGRNLQKFVCKEISEITGISYDQQNDQCLIHSREMGQSGVDVILRGKAKKLFPFAIECKNSEQLSLMDVIDQVKDNCEEGQEWLIIHKRKGLSGPIVIMDWKTFKRIYMEKGYLL